MEEFRENHLTVRQFAQKLLSLREDALDHPIVIIAPNGLLFEPEIKFRIKEGAENPFSKAKEDVSCIIIST